MEVNKDVKSLLKDITDYNLTFVKILFKKNLLSSLKKS